MIQSCFTKILNDDHCMVMIILLFAKPMYSWLVQISNEEEETLSYGKKMTNDFSKRFLFFRLSSFMSLSSSSFSPVFCAFDKAHLSLFCFSLNYYYYYCCWIMSFLSLNNSFFIFGFGFWFLALWKLHFDCIFGYIQYFQTLTTRNKKKEKIKPK